MAIQQHAAVGSPRVQTRVNNGLRIDVGSTASAIDLSNNATGESDIVVADNLASALEVRQGANTFLTVVTTNDAESVTLSKPMRTNVNTVDMADAAHALVLGTAGAAETQLTGNMAFVDPNSGGASEILTLPAEANCAGLWIMIANTGGEGIVINDDAAATVATLATAEHALVMCDGTTWYGFVGAET